MNNGNRAELKMEQNFHVSQEKNKTIYPCTMLKYQASQEIIKLLLEEGDLTDISLDAVYECKIFGDNSCLICTGRIKERYQGKDGKTLVLQIQNGFYKISLKSVDKPNT